MTKYLDGAVNFHVHAQDGNLFASAIVGAAAWVGLWLLDAKLRALFPFAKS
jgi:hypothetical protein